MFSSRWRMNEGDSLFECGAVAQTVCLVIILLFVGHIRAKDKSTLLHCFPTDRTRRQCWIEALDLKGIIRKNYFRI